MNLRMRKILVILSFTLILSIAFASLGIAYLGGVRGLGLLGVWFFMTCGIVVVLAQLIPAGILLVSLIGGTASSLRGGEVSIPAM